MSDVTIEIGRVTFDGAGVDPPGGESLTRTTESALQGLVEQKGLSFDAPDREATHVVAPDGGFSGGAGDEQTAHELAQAIYRALEMMR